MVVDCCTASVPIQVDGAPERVSAGPGLGPTILRRHRGLAASPPLRYTLKVERRTLSFLFAAVRRAADGGF